MVLSKYLKLPIYDVKGYPKNEIGKVQELFSKAFGGRQLSLDGVRWQMEQNPCLRERAVSLWRGDMLVAYTALTPCPAIFHGNDIVTAVSGTTMANEDFPGASFQLLSECEKQNDDIQIIYGFPNRNSFGICIKYLKHNYIGDVAFWSAKAVKQSVTDKIQSFSEFTDEYEKISRELSKTHIFIKRRKKDYLNWRFFQKPGIDYKGFEYIDTRRRGYIVVDIYEEEGLKQLQVVDLVADSKEVLQELLRYSVNLASEWNCKIVKLWLTSLYYKDVLEECGFVYGEHPFPMTCWSQDLDISNSYITMVDSDIF